MVGCRPKNRAAVVASGVCVLAPVPVLFFWPPMRFTIRDLVWLTLLVAMGLGWWIHAQRSAAEKRQLQRNLLMQADFVDQFVSVIHSLGCAIPPDSDPRCAAGGPYTRIFVPESLQNHFRSQGASAPVSFTLSGPRAELQRNLDGEFDLLRSIVESQ